MGDLFEVYSSKKIFHANKISNIYDSQIKGSFPYVVRTTKDNGIKGFILEDAKYANDSNTLTFAQDTFTVFFQKQPYFTGNKVKVLNPKFEVKNEYIMHFISSCFQKVLQMSSWGTSSTVETILQTQIKLPITQEGTPDYAFMESFIAELEAERTAELEAYLTTTGLKDYHLTPVEQTTLAQLETIQWGEFRLEELFGKATRGKRLKSADRVKGNLPFVTAGENNAGISAMIGNNVTIFSHNTITIDMFGSAKYRSYQYGADDHVAVIHTEHLPTNAVIFITASIHKSSHAGQFDYSRNFYASDADELKIKLPITQEGTPDYAFMERFIHALQKVVIADVVTYTDQKIQAHKTVIQNHSC